MASHTPGPWRWVAPGDLRNDGGDEVGDCLDTLDVNHLDPRCEADAHLIAAAPDLFEALDNLVEVVTCHGLLTGMCAAEVRAAEAALAKAKGVVCG